MTDYGKLLFQQSPLPTITICSCRRITAANAAAVELLGTDALSEHCGDYVCGTNCLQSLTIGDLGIVFEEAEGSWESVLRRSHEQAPRAVRHVPGFSKDAGFATITRPTKTKESELARHDSPIKDSFVSQDATDGWTALQPGALIETVRAKLHLSPFRCDDTDHYILVFTEISITQHKPAQPLNTDYDKEQDWMNRCRSAVFDSVPMLGYITDPDGRVVHFNRLTSSLLDGMTSRIVSAADLWNETFSRRFTYEEHPGIRIIRTRKELEPYHYGQIDPRTGVKYVIRAWGNCLYDVTSGEFLGSVVFAEVLGVYEELNAQAKVERLKSFETICDTMPHYVWTANEKGHGEWFSSQWLSYTGLTSDSCKGWGWKQTIHPEDLDRFTEALSQAHDQAVNYEIEARCRRHDGVYRWMLKRGAPIKDGNGKVLIWTGTNTEIHESVMARVRAKNERNQIVKAMENARVNVWAVAKEPRKLSMIEGSMILNYQFQDRGEKANGGNYDLDAGRDVQGNEGIAELERAMERVMNGEIAKAEIEIKWVDRWHKVWITPDYIDVHDAARDDGVIRGVIGCSIDMTDEKVRSALEVDNKQLSAEKHLAKEQSRMKSKFLANMSHEIRTPVAGVIGLANLLLDSRLDDDQRDHAEAIQMSAQTLLMIVNDILDFSKVESGKLTLEVIDFNLATLVTNLWKVMYYSAQQKSIEFTCVLNFPSDLCLIGDPGRIRQILTNLVSNAIKFTQQGTVKLTVTAVGTKKVRRVIFMVEDSGIGIKKEILSNLFLPFQQGDSSTARLFGGSGLGLSISRSLASLMKGHIELDSVSGRGTTATFTVPMTMTITDPDSFVGAEGPRCLLPFNRPRSVHTPAVEGSDQRRPSVAARRTKSYNDRNIPTLTPEVRKASDALLQQLPASERAKTHILLAEDNAVNRLIAVRAIEKLGFSVSAVWNGKEALEYLTTPPNKPGHKEAVVVLMDCQMPVMDGYCATDKLRNAEPYRSDVRLRGLPIVAMTASAIQGDREKCFDAGMSDYLAKPVNQGALEAMLVKWTLSRRSGEDVYTGRRASELLTLDRLGNRGTVGT